MPQLSFERRVAFSPRQMLDLVADLRTYPEFVPNCADMHVRQGRNPQEKLARMRVKFGPLDQAYTSRVEVDTQACSISAHALDGPFSHLDSKWQFFDNGAGSLVRFDIDFGFSNPLLAAAANPVFSAKQEEIVDAFISEAQRRYG